MTDQPLILFKTKSDNAEDLKETKAMFSFSSS